jgi:parallel beta-helix repeat protein
VGVALQGLGSPDIQATGNAIEGNLIAGNTEAGMSMCEATNTRIAGNRIGTERSGTEALGNGGHGIVVACAGTPRTLIEQNTIAFNEGDGVHNASEDQAELALTPTVPQGTTIRRNAIFANAGLGINLLPPGGTEDGVTGNDACDVDEGANGLQNFPELTTAEVVEGTGTVVRGTLNSLPQQVFIVEIFANDAPDPSGFGEGQRLVGQVSVYTDATCQGSFEVVVEALPGQWLTATATDGAGNTSEFSLALLVVVGASPS